MSQAPTNQFDREVARLIAESCQHPPGSFRRNSGLTKLIQAIVQSGKLWHTYDNFYEDALQQTWLYLCRNLCEANTGKQYEPEKSRVITWLNSYLKYRLLSFRQEIKQKADLMVQGLGKLECRPLLPDTENKGVCHLPPEVWEERIGYIVVEIDRSRKKATLLGFSPIAKNGQLLLNQLQPLTDLLQHLESLKQP